MIRQEILKIAAQRRPRSPEGWARALCIPPHEMGTLKDILEAMVADGTLRSEDIGLTRPAVPGKNRRARERRAPESYAQERQFQGRRAQEHQPQDPQASEHQYRNRQAKNRQVPEHQTPNRNAKNCPALDRSIPEKRDVPHEIIGAIRLHPRGFGHVSDEQGNSYFIPPRAVGQALNRDVVAIQRTGPTEGRVARVVTPQSRTITGRVVAQKRNWLLYPDNPRQNLVVWLDNATPDMEGQLAAVEVYGEIAPFSDGKRTVAGHVLRVLPGDAAGRMLAVAYDAGLSVAYPEPVLQQVQSLPAAQDWMQGIRDDTKRFVLTIDGADAQDLDDAVSIEEKQDGGYELRVHIADVSYFVQPGTPLDDEARARGTSAYLPGLTLHMLPPELSAGVCSLLPDVPRRVMTCVMDFDRDGVRRDCHLQNELICSKARLTYDGVNEFFETGQGINPRLGGVLAQCRELAKKLEQQRRERGALDFEVTESAITLDEAGNVSEVGPRPRGIAERMIESLMLAANEAVAETLTRQGLPLLYRIHQEPKPEKLQDFAATARLYGVRVSKQIKANGVGQTLEILRDSPIGAVLQNQLLRAMAKACYRAENIGHYGLGSACYCHFTSPIRRYPDLTVHRMVRAMLAGECGAKKSEDMGADAAQESGNAGVDTPQKQQPAALGKSLWQKERQELQELGPITSASERAAIDAERKAVDIRRAEYMRGFLGQVLDGVICSVLSSGFYVTLPNTCEGFVPLDSLATQMTYDPRKQCMVSANGLCLSLGQTVRVQVAAVDEAGGQVNFVLPDNMRAGGGTRMPGDGSRVRGGVKGEAFERKNAGHRHGGPKSNGKNGRGQTNNSLRNGGQKSSGQKSAEQKNGGIKSTEPRNNGQRSAGQQNSGQPGVGHDQAGQTPGERKSGGRKRRRR